ncbi:SDR family oxidoreductase [Amycolatopsis sacchari]|uniref:SDR family oxidoreductase n=1 Tax=Amycolatopsis sacchari TaxID=115433 RepID=UPI003EC155F9
MAVALITGSARGIGRAIARKLAVDGFDVVVNHRSNAEAARKVVLDVESAGRKAIAVQADVGAPEGLRDLFRATEEHFGRLDVFVGNAAATVLSPIAEISDADFDLLWRTNARATFIALRESARRMRDGGRIVIISSGSVVALNPGSGPYSATKAAGDALVRMAARELGPRGITVNSVLPGPIRTDMLTVDPGLIAARTRLGRIGEPGDIADVVSFLVSPAGSWVTGQTLGVGGGLF